MKSDLATHIVDAILSNRKYTISEMSSNIDSVVYEPICDSNYNVSPVAKVIKDVISKYYLDEFMNNFKYWMDEYFKGEYNDDIAHSRIERMTTGLVEYYIKVVCDKTNNTPEDIDNNIVNVTVETDFYKGILTYSCHGVDFNDA